MLLQEKPIDEIIKRDIALMHLKKLYPNNDIDLKNDY